MARITKTGYLFSCTACYGTTDSRIDLMWRHTDNRPEGDA